MNMVKLDELRQKRIGMTWGSQEHGIPQMTKDEVFLLGLVEQLLKEKEQVWVVAEDFESFILGIYDSEEKAKAAIEGLDEAYRDSFDYYEYQLNETKTIGV